jgi:hypothetical protein
MTLAGEAPIDTQSKAVETTAMYRSTWELATHVRHHIADLVDERRTCSSITRSPERQPGPMTQLRHRLGIALIKVGHALAGCDAVRALPASPAPPATWGSGS